MPRPLDRRRFLQRSCSIGGSLFTCSIPMNWSAHAAPVRIDAPVVDEVTVREITDNARDLFARPVEAPGLLVQRQNPGGPEGKTLCREPSWLENIELRVKKAIKCENIGQKYSHI